MNKIENDTEVIIVIIVYLWACIIKKKKYYIFAPKIKQNKTM